jgi:polysaccharide pyruvyl transferase WcaK-like protein
MTPLSRKISNRDGINVCLLGAGFETPNMGVNALTVGAIKCFLHRWPNAKIFLLDYSKTSLTYHLQFEERRICVPLVNMRFSKRFYLQNNIAFLVCLAFVLRWIPFGKIRQKVILGNECLRRIQETDLVTSLAGGDSFSDIYGLERLLYVALPQLLVLCMSRPLVQLPQTIGPFKKRFSRWIAKFIMSRSEIIYSRDDQGLQDVRELLGANFDQTKVRFSYDLGLLLDPKPPRESGLVGFSPHEKPTTCLVGLNISGLLFGGQANQTNNFGFKGDYNELVDSLLDFLLKKENVSVLLTPHVFGADGESDIVACRTLYAKLKMKYAGRLGLAAGTYNEREIKHLIGRCDFFIGSRMHSCIAAISQSVPAVSIAYSDKFVGVMKSLGVEGLVADPRTMKQEEILRIVEQAYNQREFLREQLASKMPGIKQAVLDILAGRDVRPQDVEVSSPRTAQPS